MSRAPRPLCALALLALVGAGCSSGSAGAGPAGGGNDTAINHAKAVRFAECMRSHGVSGFPDPDAAGRLTIDQVANGSSVQVNAPAFRQALATCKPLEPSGFTGAKRTPEQQAAGLKFAQCVRANGVADFPDPLPNGPLVDTNRIPSAASPGGLSNLNAAMRKCRAAAAAAGVQR